MSHTPSFVKNYARYFAAMSASGFYSGWNARTERQGKNKYKEAKLLKTERLFGSVLNGAMYGICPIIPVMNRIVRLEVACDPSLDKYDYAEYYKEFHGYYSLPPRV